MNCTHNSFSVLFVVFLFLSTSTLTFSQIDTSGFSFDIGNRWYYKNTTKGATPYKYVKTIIGIDTTGAYIVKVGKLGQDSMGIEKWKVVNGSFLINGVVQSMH